MKLYVNINTYHHSDFTRWEKYDHCALFRNSAAVSYLKHIIMVSGCCFTSQHNMQLLKIWLYRHADQCVHEQYLVFISATRMYHKLEEKEKNAFVFIISSPQVYCSGNCHFLGICMFLISWVLRGV
jgi:hypothetical protein